MPDPGPPAERDAPRRDLPPRDLPPRPATLRDVADHTGVSVATVSKALNGRDRVAPATRQRVLEAARDLHFHPDVLAQSFATGRSRTIGLLTYDAPERFAQPILAGIARALGEHDLAVLIRDAASEPDELLRNARHMAARRIDGVLVVGSGPDRRFPSLTANFDVPVVYCFRVTDDPGDVCFIPDAREMGRLAADHLLAQGRRHPVHVTASADDLSADDRATGFLDRLAAAGVEPAASPAFGEWTLRSGYRLLGELLDRGAEFDSVFAGSDQIGLGAFARLVERGLRVPQDVALVGVDNIEAADDREIGLLTSIDPDLTGLGQAAAAYLQLLIAGQDGRPGLHTHPPILRPGWSTAAARLS